MGESPPITRQLLPSTPEGFEREVAWPRARPVIHLRFLRAFILSESLAPPPIFRMPARVNVSSRPGQTPMARPSREPTGLFPRMMPWLYPYGLGGFGNANIIPDRKPAPACMWGSPRRCPHKSLTLCLRGVPFEAPRNANAP